MASSSVLNTPELLCLIFMALLSDEEVHSPFGKSGPVTLTHVCRKWRHVALAYPRLWSKFYFHMDMSMFVKEGGLTRHCAWLTEWLKRSSHLPFTFIADLNLDVKRDPLPSDYGKDTTFDKILIQNSRRLERFEFTGRLKLFHQSMPDLAFPELKTLIVHDPSHIIGAPLRLCHAPKLERMSLFGHHTPHHRFCVDRDIPPCLQFLELNVMRLEFATNSHPTNITRICFANGAFLSDNLERFPEFFPLLEELEIISLLEDKDSDPVNFVVLENLRNFTARSSYADDFLPMEYLTAPKLQSLTIERKKQGWVGWSPVSALLSFIERSSAPLEIFCNDGLDMEDEEFTAFLDLASTLKKIQFTNTPATIDMLRALAIPVQKEPSSLRCPHLQSLKFAIGPVADDASDELKSLEIQVLCALLTNRSTDEGIFRSFAYPWIIPFSKGKYNRWPLVKKRCQFHGVEIHQSPRFWR